MRKPGLCAQNTPIHILSVSPLLFKIFNICKLHEIPYEMLHNGESSFRILRTYVYTKV